MKDSIHFLLQYARKYPFSSFCILLVWVLSLLPFPEVKELEDVPFADKWTHMVMYGGTCGVLWTEYLRQHRVPDFEKLMFWAWLAPIGMSGVLELLQEYLTTSRSGEWLDLLANSIGVTLAFVFGLLTWFFAQRKYKKN